MALLVLTKPRTDNRVRKTAALLKDSGRDVTVFGLGGVSEQFVDAQGVRTIEFSHPRSSSISADGAGSQSADLVQARWPVSSAKVILLQLYFAMRALVPLIRLRPSVVHANDFDTLVLGYLVSRLIRADFVYDTHELWTERFEPSTPYPAKQIVRAIETLIARRASLVITVSDGIAQLLSNRFGSSVPVCVVKNAVHSKDFVPAAKRDNEIIIHLGNVRQNRGAEQLIEAVSLISPEDHLEVLFLGRCGERYKEDLVRLSKQLGVTTTFQDAVPRDEVARLASSSLMSFIGTIPDRLNHVHCLPNKLFESVAAGLPVIVPALPDLDSVVTTYRLGQSFEPGSAPSIADAIRQVSRNREEIQAHVLAARKVLCWEREFENALEVYPQV